MSDLVKNRKAWIVLSVALALSAWSCKDALNTDDYKIKKATANPTLDLPIAAGDLVIDDFLSKADQTNIKVYSDGLIYLLYEQTLKTQGIRDLFAFPSKNFIKTVPIPSGTLASKTTEVQYATLNTTEDFAFSPDNCCLYSSQPCLQYF
jgi:hypothetical protein